MDQPNLTASNGAVPEAPVLRELRGESGLFYGHIEPATRLLHLKRKGHPAETIDLTPYLGDLDLTYATPSAVQFSFETDHVQLEGKAVSHLALADVLRYLLRELFPAGGVHDRR